MDPTRYPPPAPPVVPPGTPPPSAGAVPPTKKNRTVLIFLIIGALLLLCCCGSGIAGYFWFMTAEESTTSSSSGGRDEVVVPLPAEEEWTQEWREFQPAADPSLGLVAPTPRQTALANEIVEAIYPEFKIDQFRVMPGYEDDDTFYMDGYVLSASLRGNPAIQIAFHMWVETEQAEAQGREPFDPANLEEYERLGTTAGGQEYVWETDMLAQLIESPDPDALDVLEQVARDWPGCVVTYLQVDGDAAYVDVTRFNGWAASDESGAEVDYELSAGTWDVTWYEFF